MSFSFLDYSFDKFSTSATFRYKGKDEVIFTEKIQFDNQLLANYNEETLDNALFLAFIILGTSYYKAAPTKNVILPYRISESQADFFNRVYQEGLSQYAFENNLTREDLAHFNGGKEGEFISSTTEVSDKYLVLLSGGKDSLLLAEKISQGEKDFKTLYITSGDTYPKIIDSFGKPLLVRRYIDKENLRKAGGLNGHVPVTLINESLALIQAVLSGFSDIQLGLGEEGIEPHAFIGDLAVNHQWSKTPMAQKAIREYVVNFTTKDITIGSLLAEYSELEIAEQFAKLCWNKFGDKFSSCNVANYRQDTKNQNLKWCGKCPKCANSYLLFAPFVPFLEQKKLFGRDLFTDSDLTETFKGLLGVDDVMKPFECIATVNELRTAYKKRLPGYGELPFDVN